MACDIETFAKSMEWGESVRVELSLNVYPEPVPEPAAILLLGTGLAGIAAFRKKFKK